jgi:hypothetical protein
MHSNEIRDYIERAPAKWQYTGGRMVNTTHVRLKWLSDLARGTINEKINRRAGVEDKFLAWKFPVDSACRRNHRNNLRKRGLKFLGTGSVYQRA